MIRPSPGLAATLSPPDGERDGVRGARASWYLELFTNACLAGSERFGQRASRCAAIASRHGRTPPPFATTCSTEFNSNCAAPVW